MAEPGIKQKLAALRREKISLDEGGEEEGKPPVPSWPAAKTGEVEPLGQKSFEAAGKQAAEAKAAPTAEKPGPTPAVQKTEEAAERPYWPNVDKTPAQQKQAPPGQQPEQKREQKPPAPVVEKMLGEPAKPGKQAAGGEQKPAVQERTPEEPVAEEEKTAEPPKPIPAIAEEIIKQKQAEAVSFPGELLEEIEEEEAGKETEAKTEGAEEEQKQEGEKEIKTPRPTESSRRKTIPELAEEIKKEKGVAEPVAAQNPAEPRLPSPPPPPYLTSPLPPEMIDRIVEAKKEAATEAPHRLYLLPAAERKKVEEAREQEAIREEETQRSFPQRLYAEAGKAPPEQEGFESMVSEVFVQVKKEEEKLEPLKEREKQEERERLKHEKEEQARREFDERRHQREERKAAREPKKEEKAPAIVSPVSIEDILGGKIEGGGAKASGVFGELEKQSGPEAGKSLFNKLEEAASPASRKQAEFTEVPKEKGCPNCKSTATKVIYCPYCGGAMCATCAANVTAFPDHFTYTCPHCGEEVDVKRKAG